jgi:hypothetical protein
MAGVFRAREWVMASGLARPAPAARQYSQPIVQGLVSANPAVAVTVKDQHPIASHVSAKWDKVVAFNQSPDRAIVSAGPAANINVSSNDDTATDARLGRGRLRRGLRRDERNRNQHQNQGEQPTLQPFSIANIADAVW